MTPCDKRWATTWDLKHYFKKSDLLGGLTELLYQLIRDNLGVQKVGEGGQSEPESLPYSSFAYLLLLKSLTTGGRYIVNDFQSIYETEDGVQGSNDSDYPSNQYTFLITAIGKDIIDPRVIVLGHEDWIVEYDPTPVRMSNGTYNKGTIVFMRDSNNNSANYDFKNIRFKRTKEQLSSLVNKDMYCYTFSDLVGGELVDASETSTNTRNNIVHDTNNVFIGDTYNNIIYVDCVGNTFLRGCSNVHLLWDSHNNIFEEPVRYLSGTVSNKHILLGNTVLSTTVTKQAHVVNAAQIVTYLDTTTYAHQIDIL